MLLDLLSDLGDVIDNHALPLLPPGYKVALVAFVDGMPERDILVLPRTTDLATISAVIERSAGRRELIS